MNRWFSIPPLALGLAALMGFTPPQPGKLIRAIRSPSGQADQLFGLSPVTVKGHIVAGAVRASPEGVYRAGAVYVYDGISGHLKRTIPNPEPAPYDYFGNRIVVHGDEIFVAAVWDTVEGVDSGSVYKIDPMTGKTLLTIRNPEPTAGDLFGAGLASVRGNIVIGAPNDDYGATNSGSIYVFDGETGDLRFTIRNPEPGAGDSFGGGTAGGGIVEHDGNILVGVPFDDPAGLTDAGSLYLFDGVTGALLLTIRKPGAVAGDWFGSSVASVSGRIVVGAPRDDPGGITDAGSAYVFDGVSGLLVHVIPNPEPTANDRFGYGGMARYRNYVLIPALWNDPGGVTNAGTVYLFSVDGALLLTIPNPEPGAGDAFGCQTGLGITQDHWGQILIGNHWDDPGGLLDGGSLYIFEGLPE
jgi:outer membrane protein assembly factor BamB